ncbi:hypothetical protein ACHHRT_10930 [Desulfurivibrio sp. D14AmB]|uniref:hypothetical protein n=1 Tax=Desulfurivibrio sp. D14AmB TaxID=3374370 RepID=UPI00376EF107
MSREKPRTVIDLVPARLPRWLIQPLRILVFTGFLLSAMFMVATEELTLIHILLISVQVVFSLALLSECGRSAAVYKNLDEAAAAARKREQEDF